MKTLLKMLAVILLGSIGAGAVIYLDNNCPQKQAKEQAKLNTAIAKYIESHPKEILEQIAKSDNFGETIKNFVTPADDELNKKIQALTDEAVNNRIEMIAQKANELKEKAVEEKVSENQIFIDNWDKITKSEAAPFVGPTEAKVVVAEFFDFACGHCKALAPIVAQLIKNNPDVKFVFNPLYFISEHSNYAATAAMAAAEKGKFVEIYEGLMTLPQLNEETINQILVDEGLDVEEIKKLMNDKKIRRGSQDIDGLSQMLGINGVPMILINGEAFFGRSLQDFQNKIDSLKN